jgi:molybdopterin molybdotransferase
LPEFLKLSNPSEALEKLLRLLPDGRCGDEEIEPSDALGRILAEDVLSPRPLPEFQRSTVDGFAVRARDTYGVSETIPGYLRVVGEIPMGDTPKISINPGECATIHTGGMLPKGTDAVIMLEFTQLVHRGKSKPGENRNITLPIPQNDNSDIEITRTVAEGENVIHIGEDVTAGQIVLKAGKRLRPAELGGCMALGITKLRVANKPRIGIISSGDEVVSPFKSPRPGQVRDINSNTLAALVKQAGGNPILFGIVPDNLEIMKSVSKQALSECDALVITAGSSASVRDTTAEAIASLGLPGVIVHGVNVRPGKPTILAACQGKAVIGLPGNPVSALVIAGLFVVPVIEKLLGVSRNLPHPFVMAELTVNVASQAGREDWIAVKLIHSPASGFQQSEREWLADPVFGKSNLIFSLASADGLVCIPAEVTGISAGEIVQVELMN